MDWKKQLPDKKGWWVRLNAIHKPQVHFIDEREGEFYISWGWAGETAIHNVKDITDKLEHFYWIRLPELPNRS